MTEYIRFSEKGNRFQVSCDHPDFITSNFYTELGAYGQLKRISINLTDLRSGLSYPFSSSSFHILQNRVNNKILILDKEYNKKVGFEEAEEMHRKATQMNGFLENPLKVMALHCKRFELEHFLREDNFEETEPILPELEGIRLPPEKPNKARYKPRVNCFHILLNMKSQRLKNARLEYKRALRLWVEDSDTYSKEAEAHQLKQEGIKLEFESLLREYHQRRREFETEKEAYNKAVSSAEFLSRNDDTRNIEKYFTLLLGAIEIPGLFTVDSSVFYENGTLIINSELPHIDDMPKIKAVRYIATRNEIKETPISKSNESKYYNNLIFSLCLFQMKLACANDRNGLIDNVAVNGYVEGRNKSTGVLERNCVVSVLSDLSTISEINLEYIEPRACFNSLKGRNGASLSDGIPVQPILQASSDDRRFIDPVDNLHTLKSESNLAALDWIEFEHLVREIFQKEFSTEGSEVKITQSSHDGGVDAIAFDPDPIKGGKIVIQAKRYTNIVGVNSVRDLYGTIINEGANRGILITTSDFGSDSHNFVKDKPISLINGNHLLYLLKKHGYNAKIDIIEAKRILKEREKQ